LLADKYRHGTKQPNKEDTMDMFSKFVKKIPNEELQIGRLIYTDLARALSLSEEDHGATSFKPTLMALVMLLSCHVSCTLDTLDSEKEGEILVDMTLKMFEELSVLTPPD